MFYVCKDSTFLFLIPKHMVFFGITIPKSILLLGIREREAMNKKDGEQRGRWVRVGNTREEIMR